MSEGADPSRGRKAPSGPENHEASLEARMASVLSSPRVRVVLPGEAIDLLLELARRVDLMAQRPAPPVGQNRPPGRDV